MAEIEKKMSDLDLSKNAENKQDGKDLQKEKAVKDETNGSEKKDVTNVSEKEDEKKSESSKDDGKTEKKADSTESPFLTNSPAPVIETKTTDKKEEEKGKEIFRGYSILYRFMPEKNELKERGIGDLVIELFPSNDLYRIRMIRKQIESYACNHYIEPICHFMQHETTKNAFVWTTTTDVCDLLSTVDDEKEEVVVDDGQDWKKDAKKSKKQTFVCRFKTPEISKEFEGAFEKAREHNKDVLKRKDN